MFRRPTTRNQHVVGRGMARRLLGGEAVQPESIRFAAELHGKPYVQEPPQARRPFNVAHTEGLVMCGVGHALHQHIGIDVEHYDRRTDIAIADRFFSTPEVRFLNRHRDEEQRRRLFLRIWTLKESFIKAIGTGLQTPLADFAFEDIESDSPTIKMLDAKLESEMTWRFYSFQPRPGFIAATAIAIQDPDEPTAVELCNFDELVSP